MLPLVISELRVIDHIVDKLSGTDLENFERLERHR